MIAKLRKTLYGLRRSPKLFTDGLADHLISKGYTRLTSDPCIYRKDKGGESIIFNTHVDDFACFPTCESMFTELVHDLQEKYRITTSDNLDGHLGMRVNKYADGAVGLSQPKQLEFKLAGLEDNSNGASTPMATDFNDDEQSDSPRCDLTKYQSLLGSLIHILKTRSDVAFAISRMSSRTQVSTEKDMEALRRICRYLLRTRKYELIFSPSAQAQREAVITMFAWADAAYQTHADSKGHSGYCMGIGDGASGKVIAGSEKQALNTLSACESEIHSAVSGTTNVMWLRDLLDEPLIFFPHYSYFFSH